MYYLLDYLVAGIKITISYMKKPRGGSCNSGKSPLSLGAYLKMCQILIYSNKPKHEIVHFFYSGVISYVSG